MNSPLAIHPDLNECLLEDRTLLAYSPIVAPVILTTGGYIVLATPPGFSTVLGTQGGSAGSSSSPSGGSGGGGGNMPTSFNISGFGPSTFAIGNNTGFPALSQSRGAASGGVNFGAVVGSGANVPGGGSGSPSASPSANGGFAGNISSGYNFALSSQNGFGVSPNAIGSVPVHTYANATETTPDAQSGTNPAVAQDMSPNSTPTPNLNPGPESMGPNFGSKLLGKKLFGPVPLVTKPAQFN